jgi:protein ImuB
MSQVLQSLGVAVREAVPASIRERRPALVKPQPGLGQLWLAVRLSNLAFDALSSAATQDPAVVVEPLRGQIYVIAANRQAHLCGIRRGCKLNSARALAASLRVFERSHHREQSNLESLAAWAHELTPRVCVEPPETLLLEVSGSIRLFQGLAAIKQKIDAEVEKRHESWRLCAAPTSLAALWLVRSGAREDVLSLDSLAGRLGALPLRVTRWPIETLELLEDLGARTLGDCLRLPREGFARRIGVQYLHDLDRALGRLFDWREEFVPRTHFHARRELYQESSDCAVLMVAIEQIVDDLVLELRRRQAQVRSVRILFEHVQHPPTRERFDWVAPAHERDRLLHLLRDRIERIVLPAPVIGLSVTTGALQALQSPPAELFDKKPIETLAHVLIERLRGRLGTDAIFGMRATAEHRPEHAWTKSAANPAIARTPQVLSPWAGDRPLWLLPMPLPLASHDARRYYQGALELRSSAEIIESGWWDEQDVRRDYFVAVSSRGQRLWVYRDRDTHDWHLHGLFG